MKQAFDNAAVDYDQSFTNSSIGRALRKIVWNYLEIILEKNKTYSILELNCGTGEDAVFLGRLGNNVTATDVSDQMLEIAAKKLLSAGLNETVKVVHCDVMDVGKRFHESAFDLVFSNFGGLNCLNPEELSLLSKDVDRLLKPNGRFIAVAMGRYCLWESLYFAFKVETSKVFRRNTDNAVGVNVNGEEVDTWYFGPDKFLSSFDNYFRKMKLMPLGVFLPPSYMEPFFSKHKRVLKGLGKLEDAFTNAPMLAHISDHYIIDLQKK